MDNTKAIALLRRMQEPEAYEPKITAEAFEALGMAIKALEQADHIAEASKKATQPEVRTQMSSADCIGRQAAIDAISTPRGILYPIRTIEELPSAQPEQPKKGRWTRPFPTRPKTYERFCSECKGKAWYCGTGDYNFCPNCGADMREGEAERRTN